MAKVVQAAHKTSELCCQVSHIIRCTENYRYQYLPAVYFSIFNNSAIRYGLYWHLEHLEQRLTRDAL